MMLQIRIRYAVCFSWFRLLTEHRRLGGLKNKHSFLTILKAGKPKIKVLVDPMSGEGLPPGLQMALHSLYPHLGRGDFMACVSSYEDTNTTHGVSTLMT